MKVHPEPLMLTHDQLARIRSAATQPNAMLRGSHSFGRRRGEHYWCLTYSSDAFCGTLVRTSSWAVYLHAVGVCTATFRAARERA
jgi:hypothetical protein